MDSGFATVKGYQLHFTREGDDGLPIFLVHGVPSASFRWRPVQQLISPYLKTYAYDLIGMARATSRAWVGITPSRTTPT